MKELWRQLVAIWSGGTPSQRVMASLSGVVAVVGVVASIYLATRPDFALLFGNLEPTDAAMIVEQVRDAGVVADVRDGGRSVYVPRDRVSEMRMNASAGGLPRGGNEGWELFDNSTFGVSDYVQNINYRRALQGELARNIESFEAVERAAVNISRPKRSPFVGDDTRPKASVIVHTRGSRTLSAENVRAITHLVSGAVEGLPADEVRVVDGRGRLLTDGESDTLAAAADKQLEFRVREEEVRRERAQAMLDRMQIKADVRVAVEVEFQNIRETSELFEPKGTVLSETVQSRTMKPAGSSAGPAGTEAKISGVAASSGGPMPTEENDETTTTTYGTGRRVTSQDIQSPRVRRLAVSLVVHADHNDRLSEIEELVKAAVLFDETRDDQLRSMVHEFTVGDVVEAPVDEGVPWIVQVVLERVVQVAGVLGALFLLFRMLRGAESKRVAREAVASIPSPTSALAAERVEPEAVEEIFSGASLKESVRSTIESDPGTATRVLRSWLKGEAN